MLELLEFLSKNPTLPVVIFGSVVAFVSLRSQQHLTRAKHTLDFDKEFKEKDQVNLFQASIALKKLSSNQLIALAKSGDRTNPDYVNISSALNIWEGVAIGIQQKVYSEDLLFDAYASSIVWLFKFSLPFIKERQKHNERFYKNFVQLCIKWSSRLSVPMATENQLKAKEVKLLEDQQEADKLLRESIRVELLAEMRHSEQAARQ